MARTNQFDDDGHGGAPVPVTGLDPSLPRDEAIATLMAVTGASYAVASLIVSRSSAEVPELSDRDRAIAAMMVGSAVAYDEAAALYDAAPDVPPPFGTLPQDPVVESPPVVVVPFDPATWDWTSELRPSVDVVPGDELLEVLNLSSVRPLRAMGISEDGRWGWQTIEGIGGVVLCRWPVWEGGVSDAVVDLRRREARAIVDEARALQATLNTEGVSRSAAALTATAAGLAETLAAIDLSGLEEPTGGWTLANFTVVGAARINQTNAALRSVMAVVAGAVEGMRGIAENNQALAAQNAGQAAALDKLVRASRLVGDDAGGAEHGPYGVTGTLGTDGSGEPVPAVPERVG